ncbi:hypothetical protein DXG01_004873 [Tephrocybe rancida]|nr:hypothetical protein DXG01_004873 [Tephrocybe rancida]
MSPRDHLPRLDGTQLSATLAESLFYGAPSPEYLLFTLLMITDHEALLYRARVRRESIFKPMPITATILFLTITAHWILDLLLVFEAFILPPDKDYCVTSGSLNPAERVYLNLPDAKNVLTSAFYVLTTLVGDGFMIYRLYIVWSRNLYIIILPVLMLGALAVTGGMVTYLFSQATTPLFQAAVARSHRSVNATSQQQISTQQQLSTTNLRTRHISHAMRPLAVKITTVVEDSIDPKISDFGTPPVSPGVYSIQSVTPTHEMRQKEEV